MKQYLTLIGCLSSLLLPALPVLAEDDSDISFAEGEIEVTVSLTSALRDDVDFDTTTHTLGVKAKTPYGLMLCDYGSETGDTRIDTFDDIFGIQPVFTTLWNGYDATLLQCGYGLKLPLAGGELSGGIGFLRYNGETDSMVDGKENEADAFRLQAKYLYGDTDTRMQLVHQSYSYLYHYLAGYDSLASGSIRTISLEGDWGPIYAEAKHIHGDKQKDFVTPPLPFPYAEFDYEQVTVSLGPNFNGNMGPLRYLAPTYTSGSERGTYNRMRLDNGFHGLIAGMAFGSTELRLAYLGTESDGNRDYSPVTTNLAEAMKRSKLVAELEADSWSLTLENNRLIHDGFITATSNPIPYTLLTGCPATSCDYNNVRRENEWKLGWGYHYSDHIELNGDLYQRQRRDTQYHYPERKYSEAGGNLGITVTF